MSIAIPRVNCNVWDTTTGTAWVNRGDTVVHNDKVVYQFDFRDLARSLLAKYKDAYLEYVWGDRWTKESKNGGQVPIYCPSISGGGSGRADRAH